MGVPVLKIVIKNIVVLLLAQSRVTYLLESRSFASCKSIYKKKCKINGTVVVQKNEKKCGLQ